MRNESCFVGTNATTPLETIREHRSFLVIFEPGGIISASNASAVVDGAAAMVLCKESDVEKHGLKPLARVIGMGVAACDPEIMGWGPVPSTRMALARAGIKGGDLDHVELNEAFAPQALACIADFEKWGSIPRRSTRWEMRSLWDIPSGRQERSSR